VTGCEAVVVPVVAWLRRPVDLVAKANAFVQTYRITSLQELEALVPRLNLTVIPADLSPNTYGLTTRCNGETLIFMQPHLDRHHREFTLAHEIGHLQLHLQDERLVTESSISNPSIGGLKDVEADCFLFVCLVRCLPIEELPKYVLANPNMISRSLGILRYVMFYRLRMVTADMLERFFVRTNAKGVA
jgi:Zn-dependent peptidase ImmA (M78 family)